MITLAAPVSALMDRDPLTVGPEDLLSDISDQVKTVHYGAAVAVDGRRRPIGVVTRSDLVRPTPRRVLLVDHAEQAQSVLGVGEAEIVEILDHHHIGSVETTVPVTATFDPVGSTATLVIERFRQSGMEPSKPTATMLLGALLSDTVILNSPTTTERDRDVADYLERVLALDPVEFGSAMFEETSNVSAAARRRDPRPRRQGVRGRRRPDDLHRPGGGRRQGTARAQGRAARGARRRARAQGLLGLRADGHRHPHQGNRPATSGDRATIERAFDEHPADGHVNLPGIMSRKKQVAPKLLAAAAR